MNEANKLKIIRCIDQLSERIKSKVYLNDLRKLRNKYIYKDISMKEYVEDVKFLKGILDLINEKNKKIYDERRNQTVLQGVLFNYEGTERRGMERKKERVS